ncbi:MAG: hypothetical protein CMJ58_01480 [Planctomycetaceae bacterium]|nr:hypothetical protein [Planctomycetaceae bacterium]
MTQENQTTRERLLRAAIVAFAEEGLDSANLRDICARAEVNLNAVRYHFGGKEPLYIAAVESAHRTIVGDRHAYDQRGGMSEDAPEVQLREIIAGMLAVSMSEIDRMSPEAMLMRREMMTPTEATAHMARSYVKPRFDYLNSVIARLLPSGTPKIEQHMLAISVVSQCFHFKFGRQMDQLVISKSEYRKFTIPRLTDHVLRVTLAAIRDYSVSNAEPSTR